jgi:hypothetical protein
VWLASVRDRSVYRVDPETLRWIRIPMPEQPMEIAIDAGSVWVTSSSTLVRIDPITERIVERIRLGGCTLCPTDVAAADGMAWATHYDDERLIRVDPARGVSDRQHLVSRPVAMAVGHGAVWILHDDQAGIFLIERIDIGTRRSQERRLPLEADGPLQCLEHDVGPAFPAELCAAITVGPRAVWVATPRDDVSWLWRLDPDDGRLIDDGSRIDCCAMAMVATTDEPLTTIWIGGSSGDIVQVPEVEGVPSDEVLRIGLPVTDIAIGYGAIWISVDGPQA